MPAVLGFDTSTNDVSAALADGERGIAEVLLEGPAEGPPQHNTELLPAIYRLVDDSGGWEAVERIAVGVGPGSYTGLRIGIATARALSQGLGKQLAGVSSLAALAAGMAELEAASGRMRLPLIDARRRETFGMLTGPSGEVEWPAFVAGPDELAARLSQARITPLAAGSGALRFRRELEAAGVEVLPGDHRAHRV